MFGDNFQLNRYETWELDTMLAQIERANPWLLRTFFSREKYFQSRSIEFDMVDRGRRLAPFVSPMAAGKPMRREGYRTQQIAPAYIKPTDLLVPQDSWTRQPGEGYGGVLSPQQRFDRMVSEKLDDFDQMITNRMEWMAASALVNGSIRIVGEDYPEVLVDFGRDASLNGVLFGAALWSAATSKPADDIEQYALLVRKVSKGAVVSDLVMDGASWAALRKNTALQDLLDIRFRRHMGVQESAIDQGPRNTLNEAVHVGVLSGRFNVWVYDSYYQDDNGVDQPFIPAGTVLGIASAALEGTAYYGGIVDLDAGMQAVKMFTKSEKKFNPSGLEIVAQSAPLVAPKRVNAMFKLTVL